MQKLLFLSFFLFFATSAGAQTFRGSALFGVNFSQIDGDDLNGFYQPGLNAGLRVVAILSDRWRVGPEILFSQQGARRNANTVNISPYDRFRLNTLEVPLMVYFKDWRITAEAGFSYQRLINFSALDSGGQDITEVTEFEENLVAFKAGATIYFSPNWGMNMRWSKHLSDFNRQAPDFRGRTVSLRLVYTFGDGEEMPQPIEEQ
ncbi:outer membrane beta-barrel protein [Lewinella sp. W8]|uniref:outer membrane beta-barrel protein n=1 Tax=Lewinella sp. W8 TaxID=2528208 RepID=UPI001563BD9C|nr:outer membrane beta-barrel protein [Lewinella sp. W8]